MIFIKSIEYDYGISLLVIENGFYFGIESYDGYLRQINRLFQEILSDSHIKTVTAIEYLGLIETITFTDMNITVYDVDNMLDSYDYCLVRID